MKFCSPAHGFKAAACEDDEKVPLAVVFVVIATAVNIDSKARPSRNAIGFGPRFVEEPSVLIFGYRLFANCRGASEKEAHNARGHTNYSPLALITFEDYRT